jgi:X-X-X-Leu-X-X-Gly heptad repeat protein
MKLYRLSFLAGLAAGFVAGARAGRERYEQLKKLARATAENPTVQQAAGALQAQATGLASSARDKVSQKLQSGAPTLASKAQKIGDRIPRRRHGSNGSASEPAESSDSTAASQ